MNLTLSIIFNCLEASYYTSYLDHLVALCLLQNTPLLIHGSFPLIIVSIPSLATVDLLVIRPNPPRTIVYLRGQPQTTTYACNLWWVSLDTISTKPQTLSCGLRILSRDVDSRVIFAVYVVSPSTQCATTFGSIRSRSLGTHKLLRNTRRICNDLFLSSKHFLIQNCAAHKQHKHRQFFLTNLSQQLQYTPYSYQGCHTRRLKAFWWVGDPVHYALYEPGRVL
jgi:hypothetical protein